MNFEAIEKALVVMGNAMVAVIGRLDELISVNKEILEELKKKNN